MNTSLRLLSAAALSFGLLAGSSASAQTNTTPVVTTDATGQTLGSGLLGKRYVDAGFGYIDFKDFNDNQLSAGGSINLPVNANIDLGVGYSYNWLDDHSSIDAHAWDVGATYYFTQGSIKPFGTVSLGYIFQDFADDEATWGVSAGLEFLATEKLSFRASVGYDDYFDNAYDESISGGVDVAYWFSEKVAGQVGARLFEGGDRGAAASIVIRF